MLQHSWYFITSKFTNFTELQYGVAKKQGIRFGLVWFGLFIHSVPYVILDTSGCFNTYVTNFSWVFSTPK